MITIDSIAIGYAPELTRKSAIRRLRYWIERCEPLKLNLRMCGYNNRIRHLRPEHVRLIYQYLGEP
ncbi:MAG: DUF4248 domain-containing protein [Bacteroidales bacterium]